MPSRPGHCYREKSYSELGCWPRPGLASRDGSQLLPGNRDWGHFYQLPPPAPAGLSDQEPILVISEEFTM